MRRLASHCREGIEDIAVIGGIADQRQDVALVDIHDNDCRAIGIVRKRTIGESLPQNAADSSLQIGINRQPQALWDLRPRLAQHAQTPSIRRHQRKPSAGRAGQRAVHAGFYAGFADDGLGMQSGFQQARQLFGICITDMPDDVWHQRAIQIAPRWLLHEVGGAGWLNAVVQANKCVSFDHAGVNDPVGLGTPIEQFVHIGRRLARGFCQRLKTGCAVGNAAVVDLDAHDASILVS